MHHVSYILTHGYISSGLFLPCRIFDVDVSLLGIFMPNFPLTTQCQFQREYAITILVLIIDKLQKIAFTLL
jgi:hypothetical protein